MAVETANGRENRFGRENSMKMPLCGAMAYLMKNALCIYVSHCSALVAGALGVAGKGTLNIVTRSYHKWKNT